MSFIPCRMDWDITSRTVFVDYIARHGGMDASGPPITELFRVNHQLERQCFTNLCLELLHQSSGSDPRPSSSAWFLLTECSSFAR